MSELYDLVEKLSETEALDLFYELRYRHGWQGVVWGEVDLEDLWNELRRPEGLDIEAKPWTEVRENVMSGRGFTRWFAETLVEQGNMYLADWILELDENGNEII